MCVRMRFGRHSAEMKLSTIAYFLWVYMKHSQCNGSKKKTHRSRSVLQVTGFRVAAVVVAVAATEHTFYARCVHTCMRVQRCKGGW